MRPMRTLTFLLPLLLAGCGGAPPGEQAPAAAASAAVRTAIAAPETVPVVSWATGSVEAWARSSPGTKILGRIAEVPAREGDRVEKGAVLARLESRDLQAAVRQARAAVALAEANRENAAAQHRRMEELHARGSVTDKNLEDAVAAIRVAEAALGQAEAALAAAEVTLSYAEVHSPLSGWVVARRAEAGDMAVPGAPLLTVEDLSRVKIVAQVPESDVIGLQRGDPARVRVDALGRELPATVHRLVPAGDPHSRTFEVQLVVENADGALKSGMFARAGFPRGGRPALRVPQEAVVQRGQLRGLFVVGPEGQAHLRWVRLGRAEGGRVEILSGLEPGERYVASPPAGFADGTVVREG